MTDNDNKELMDAIKKKILETIESKDDDKFKQQAAQKLSRQFSEEFSDLSKRYELLAETMGIELVAMLSGTLSFVSKEEDDTLKSSVAFAINTNQPPKVLRLLDGQMKCVEILMEQAEKEDEEKEEPEKEPSLGEMFSEEEKQKMGL